VLFGKDALLPSLLLSARYVGIKREMQGVGRLLQKRREGRMNTLKEDSKISRIGPFGVIE